MNWGDMSELIVAPDVQLLNSMRSVGYSFEAALADIIDNSIAANARNVILDIDVVDGRYVAILDDGDGMSPETAREALRFAGSVRERSGSDLGRFGLGLKTASLSQGRCLTVLTKRANEMTCLRWDIDHVETAGKWSLLVLEDTSSDFLPLAQLLAGQESGTLVVWEKLDLLVGDSDDPGEFLKEKILDVSRALSLTFHRFLEPPRPLRLELNGDSLKPIDPFLTANPKTQRSATQVVQVADADVPVTAYTLPHHSGLTAEERSRPDLSDGMREAQGFYVYRNRRLISKGHWFGMARLSEISKQTRIQVDIPNSLDSLWQLDIKKSRAEPPQSFKVQLRRIIDPILEKGKRVHTFRGRKADQGEIAHIWTKQTAREGFFYEINLEHPYVRSVLSQLVSSDAEKVVLLLEAISQSFPILDAYQELAANRPSKELESPDVRSKLREIRDSNVLGTDLEKVIEVLSAAEPFNSLSDLRLQVEEVWRSHD